jgi:hypothetical protein
MERRLWGGRREEGTESEGNSGVERNQRRERVPLLLGCRQTLSSPAQEVVPPCGTAVCL